MSIEKERESRICRPGMAPAGPLSRSGALVVALLSAAILSGCGGGDESGADVGAPADAPAMESPAPSGAAEQPVPQTPGDLFPEGEGRDLLLANCTSCHAVACSAMGQRTESRWQSLQEAHREHASSMSGENLELVFTYLQNNFSDSQPEPFIPPAFLEQGCTPF
jgi:hypothetical protein